MSRFPRVLPVGDAAVTVELGDTIDPEVSSRVRALDRTLGHEPFDGFLEAVPCWRSLLVLYDPARTTFERVFDVVHCALPVSLDADAGGTVHMVPTRYGGEEGPDLEDVARATGLTVAEVIALHSGTEYTAEMLGFMPGFAYLGWLPPALETPRRRTPRTLVRAGSVAIAARQTAIYPSDSPGGWNLIGRTSRVLFDPHRSSPALILPGDRVRFAPVDALEESPARPVREIAAGRQALEVLDGGLLTTVQDRGRFGLRRVGVAIAGPMDVASFLWANGAVGNPGMAAALECTMTGPEVRFLEPTRFALAGAELGAVLDRSDLGPWEVPQGRAVLARVGNVLRFQGRRSGCRAYIAFAGGVDVPAVLGSRSTDLAGRFGGFGGRALRAGDRLALGTADGADETRSGAQPASHPSAATVRVILGPQAEVFDARSVERFLAETWSVTSTSDRIGCRLAGPQLHRREPGETVTDGMVFGSIEVPPDGQPIVMMADAPTTGGYPKIATIVTADLPLLAQLVPGEGRVRFEVVKTG